MLKQLSVLSVVALIAACNNDPGYSVSTDLHPVVKISNGMGGHGTGFYISSHLLLTAEHVAESLERFPDRAFIENYNGDTGSFVPLERSVPFDLALVYTDLPAIATSRLGCDGVEYGDRIHVTGHPIMAQWATFSGYVSSTYPTEYPIFPDMDPDHIFLIDVGINTGISGGPIHDENENVVAVIVGLILAESPMGDGFGSHMGIAVSGTAVCEFVEGKY